MFLRIVVACLLIGLVGCSEEAEKKAPAQAEGKAIATVNGKKIGEEEFNKFLQFLVFDISQSIDHLQYDSLLPPF